MPKTGPELVHLLYDVFLEPGGWDAFLAEVQASMGAQASAFHSHDSSSASGQLDLALGLDEPNLASFNAYYHAKNVFSIEALPHLREGIVLDSSEFLSSRILRRSEFFVDWFEPMGLLHSMGGNILLRDTLMSNVTFARDAHLPPFSLDDRNLLSQLLPHIRRAVQVHRRLSSLEQSARARVEAVDLLPHGLVLLSKSCTIVLANRSAEGILSAGDGIARHRGALRLSSSRANSKLESLVRAVSSDAHENASSGGMLVVERASGLRGYLVLVSRVPFQWRRVPGSPAASVTITDPETSLPKPRPDCYSVAFGLSAAENRFASLVASGLSITEIAEELGISINTARTHLKRILAKTGTNRQAELVRLLLATSPPPVPPDTRA